MFISFNNGIRGNRLGSLQDSGLFGVPQGSEIALGDVCGIMTHVTKLYSKSKIPSKQRTYPVRCGLKNRRGKYAATIIDKSSWGVLALFSRKSIQHTLSYLLGMCKNLIRAGVGRFNTDETSSRNREVALQTLINYFVSTVVGLYKFN